MVVHTTPSARKPEEGQFDQAKGAFLASLNHEVRTPLSGIVGMLDLLSETALDEDQRDYLNAARLCTESLTELLNASLEYAALEAGQITLDESEFNLRETLEAAIALFQPKAAMKRIRLSLTMDGGLPETMMGDAPRVRELLGHLLSNAVKFTHQGAVELRASLENAADGSPFLRCTITDTGVGIPADKLEGIFDSFRQGDDGLSRGYPGLGLGLALTHRLVGVMAGRITVDSEIGRGSSFTVELPYRRSGEVRVFVEMPAAQAEGPVILAVEDNPVGLRVLRHVLQRRNFNVVCATSGREAIEAAKAQKVDLILMDLQMPDINGLEASAAIRQLPGYEQTPILALTANYSDQTREQCLAAGMQAFLSKPVDANELWSTVSRYLKNVHA
jgi:CheY-like chemotaxis protein/anti-sigma regulatory factor (Ser/Thr protein kinase)